MIDNYQYYPTPEALSEQAWRKFKNRDLARILEPSAGEGHLLKCCPNRHWQKIPVDCVEIDIEKHLILRAQGYAVVGMDFLQFNNGSMYSHVIMNPPFAEGAKHVLKAWEILFDGEIVAILNAETLKNPYTRERKLLLSLIEQYGEVEYLPQMFVGQDAERQTEVEIALVWLDKTSRFEQEILGKILDDLKTDTANEDSLAADFTDMNPLALPNSFIENAVLMFNAAVESARQVVMSEARANRYRQMLGKTLGQLNGHGAFDDNHSSVHWVKQQLYERYIDLKDRAWTGILRSTQVTAKLSSSAQKRLEADFETIKVLEFTVTNIYGFLQGILDRQDEIQIGMACDVFDLITRYHSENVVFYLGWKSNDKHRTLGMRIKTTRFVIPGHKTESYQRDLSWDSGRILADIDKVFAMLDGKREPELSLETVFSRHFQELRNGGRVSASYFDVRYYPGIGTIHFFPTSKKLIDRLNRIVGNHRRWLPQTESNASPAFWKQYDQAEKFDKAFHAELKKHTRRPDRCLPFDPFWAMRHGGEDEKQKANAMLINAMTTVLEQNGIHADDLLETEPEQLMLAC
jgi:hypothetical protein